MFPTKDKEKWCIYRKTSNRECVASRFPSFSAQLPRVDKVVPNGIEATGKGGDGTEEGVAHPDSEDRVFLTQRLSASHRLAVLSPNETAKNKLQQTANEGADGNAHHRP